MLYPIRAQGLALTAVTVVAYGASGQAIANAAAMRAVAPAATSFLIAQQSPQSEDRFQSNRGPHHAAIAAREPGVCKEMRLVDRGHPGKDDAVFEAVTVDCPEERSAIREAQRRELCGQTILVKRGYPGQGREVLESAEIRCPRHQARPRPGEERRRGMQEPKLCEAQRLVWRGNPGKGEDIFQTVLVDCPADRS